VRGLEPPRSKAPLGP